VTLAEAMGLRHAGPAGWVAGAAWIAASAFAVALLFRAARGSSRSLGNLATLTVACAGVGLLGSAFVLADARRRMLAIALHLEDPARDWPDQAPLRWFGAIESTRITLFDAGVGLAFCAASLALCAFLSLARAGGLPAWGTPESDPRRGGSPRRLAIVLAVAALATTMGLDAMRVSAALAVEQGTGLGGGPSLQSLAQCVDAPLADARAHIAAVAAIGWIVAAGACLRARERTFGRLAGLGAGGVFILGVLAFVATRRMAYDAHNPIPIDPIDPRGCPVTVFDPRTLPVVEGGEPDSPAQILELRRGEALLDTVSAPEPAELDEMLRRRRDLWVQVNHRPTSGMPSVRIVAPEILGTVEVAIWLRAIEEHLGGGFILVGVEPERRFSTRTLGELSGTPRCSGIPVQLDPAGPSLTSYPTWGDVARARREAGVPLRIRLR
jgi:hypothetical protein